MDDRLSKALEAHQRGDFATADRLYSEVLASDPAQYDALRLRGVLLLQRGAPEESRALLARATEVRPGDPEAWVNLATLEQMVGNLQAAIDALGKALAADPRLAAAHNNHGNVLLMAGRPEEAEAAYQHALSLEPGDPGLLLNLAGSLHAQGRLADAEAKCRDALARDPNFAPAEAMLGAIHADGGNLEAAEASLRSALQKNPGHAEWRYSLAQVVENEGSWTGALTELRRAAGDRADWFQPSSAAMFLARRIGDWSQHQKDVERYRKALAERRPGASPFIALFETDDRAVQKDAARLWAVQTVQSVKAVAATRDFRHDRTARDKVTVGYLSSGFGSHATAALTAGVFEQHDHSRFRTIAYSLSPNDGTDLAARVRRTFDTFHEVHDWSPGRIADQVYKDQVDILVDLNGYTDGGQPAVMALQAAPIQISWLAYPGTMGGLVHYLVADDRLIREGEDGDYDEAIIRLDGCYQPTDPARVIATTPSRAAMGLPEDAVVFACFNNGYKISPEVFDDWMAILEAVPSSVLWLLDGSPEHSLEENFRKEATARGIDAGRLVFCGKAAHAEYLARYRVADLVLDTFPYTAHTTASDALFAGCPLLTREGDSFASRVAASILSDLGLDELITRDAADFRDKAILLAKDADARAALRERIQSSLDDGADLWDPARYARLWETALETVIGRWLEGSPIAPLDVHIEDLGSQP
jgi:predicted O-linked N-acetylglucosamine transferase (SPINDLY family)